MSSYPLSRGITEEILRYMAKYGQVQNMYSLAWEESKGYTVVSVSSLKVSPTTQFSNESISAKAKIILHDKDDEIAEVDLFLNLSFSKALQMISEEDGKLEVVL